VPVIYQGICSRDHSGLSTDAGGDWNGDGLLDVILGGGSKVDTEGQPGRIDESANVASLFLRGTSTVPRAVTCESGAPNTPPAPQPVQYPNLVLRGTQVSPVPLGDGESDRWMLADRFGWCVRFVGDIDELVGPESQFYDDFAASAPWFDVTAGDGSVLYQAGAVYLYLGREVGDPQPTTSAYQVRDSDDPTGTGAGGGYCDLIIEGEAAGDYFGYSIARWTDFDGDGIDDLVVGAPQYAWQDDYDPAATSMTTTDEIWPNDDDRPGKVYVIWGAGIRAQLADPSLPADKRVSIADLKAAGRAIELLSPTGSPRDRFGASLDGLGNQLAGVDLEGDELVIGAPQFRSDWGAGGVDEKSADTALDDSDGGDGYVELWSYNPTSGPSRVVRISGPAEDPVAQQESEGLRPRFGWAVSRVASDLDSTAYGFVVTAPEYDILVDPSGPTIWNNVGLAHLYTWTGATATTPSPVWVGTGSQADEEFGTSVTSGGDFNADGIADFAVGSRLFTRVAALGPCACTGARPMQGGRLLVLSSTPLCGIGNCRVLGRLRGEETRDRLGFSCAFTGDVIGGSGDDLIGSALAWPSQLEPDALIGPSCPPCLGCDASKEELGRGYLFSWEQGNGQ
jgi:hypothetical protein